MKKHISFVFIASIIMAVSCSEEVEIPGIQGEAEGNATLKISVSEEPLTKVTGQQSGTSFPAGSELGVFVTEESGSSYEGKYYDNIKFTSTETGAEQTWAYDEATPVVLSSTKAKVYAYYPRVASGVTLNSIPISNDGNDWMYTPYAAGDINAFYATAPLSMRHAMTIIRVVVQRPSGYALGDVSVLMAEGTGWATSATLDLQNGTIGSYSGEGTPLLAEDFGVINESSMTHDFWVISNETESVISFKVKVGEDYFRVNTPTAVALQRGRVYTYTLNVSDPDWQYLENGVYAVNEYGGPVDYTTASTAAVGTYKGVAVVMKGKAFEVAKEDAPARTKWAESNPMTEAEQAQFSSNYITKATENISWGYLKKPDGTYYSSSTASNQIPDDISTWTGSCALADLDGKANTDRIIAAGVTIANVINSYNDGSHGSTNWYLPAAGQLAYMFMNYNKINDLLTKFSGTSMSTSDSYWSSSVYSANYAWDGGFSNGSVGYYDVTATLRVRLVQDL